MFVRKFQNLLAKINPPKNQKSLKSAVTFVVGRTNCLKNTIQIHVKIKLDFKERSCGNAHDM